MTDTNFFRYLTPTEMLMAKIDQAHPFNIQCIFTLYDNTITIEAISNALYLLQKKHLLLNVSLAFNDLFNFEIQETSIPLYVLNPNIDSIDIEAHKVINQSLNSKNDLCIIVHYMRMHENEHKFIFTLNHLIADGVSLSNLVISFSDILNNKYSINHFQASDGLALEKLVNSDYLENSYKELNFSNKTANLSSTVIHPNNKNIMQLFDEHTTSKLIAYAKTHKITITQLLSAILILSAIEVLPILHQADTILCDIPINVRNLINPPISNNYLGNLVSGIYLPIPKNLVVETDLLSLAKLIKKLFKQKFNPTTILKECQQMTYEECMKKSLSNIMNIDYPVLGVSNMGVVKSDSKIKNNFFINTSLHSMWCKYYLFFMSVITINGCLSISIHSAKFISENQAERLYQNLVFNINKIQ